MSTSNWYVVSVDTPGFKGFVTQSPSIPTILSTFPTKMDLLLASSMPPVQAVAQLQVIGTLSPLTQQVTWELSSIAIDSNDAVHISYRDSY